MTGIDASDFLKSLKQQKGWTQQQMADALNVDIKSIGRYLAGGRCAPAVVNILMEQYGFQPKIQDNVVMALNRVEQNQEVMMVMMKKMTAVLARLDRQK